MIFSIINRLKKQCNWIIVFVECLNWFFLLSGNMYNASAAPQNMSSAIVSAAWSGGGGAPLSANSSSNPSAVANSGSQQQPSWYQCRPVWIDKAMQDIIKVPHTFIVHTYKTPTICQYCRKLLKGIYKQGYQCKGEKVVVVFRRCKLIFFELC